MVDVGVALLDGPGEGPVAVDHRVGHDEQLSLDLASEHEQLGAKGLQIGFEIDWHGVKAIGEVFEVFRSLAAVQHVAWSRAGGVAEFVWDQPNRPET